MPGVYVNDVYSADMTPAEVNAKLVSMEDTGDFTVILRDGEEITFSLAEFGYYYTFLDDLQALNKEESALKLAYRVTYERDMFCEHSFEPKGVFDKGELDKYLDKYEQLDDRKDGKKAKVEIVKGKNGYELVDGMQDLLDGEMARDCIAKAIESGERRIDLDEAGCYVKKDYTDKMRETITLFKELNKLQDCDIKMLFTREVEVTPSVTCNWIKLDETGNFYRDEDGKLCLDEDRVKEYVEKLAQEFDTINRPRTFRAHNGRTVTINSNTYGNQIDQKAEFDFLMEAVASSYKGSHEPNYKIKAYGDGTGDDIGNTFIEVDMTAQTLYYYRNGSLAIETPVVTGNTRLGRGTPEKVCYVYFKQRNRVLRGEDYATPVSYWIAVNGHIGIHDASWRSKFGGDIYKTNGSHGCINTPTKAVSELYDMVEIGTPVLIYY